MAAVVGCVSMSRLFFICSERPPARPQSLEPKSSTVLASTGKGTRRTLSLFLILNWIPFQAAAAAAAAAAVVSDFVDIPYSGGVKALQLKIGSGSVPADGDKVAIHYYARLGAKQGWRFDSTYDHKDDTGDSIPFFFTLGSGKVIPGIEAAVKSMKVGGIQRVVIPPSQGYQNTAQEPLPPNFFDQQRLFTTIFNPTRLANGEGSTLGTLIFDIKLMSICHSSMSPHHELQHK